MKKILILFLLYILPLFSCSKFDLTDYHMVGDKWSYELNGVNYHFEYVSWNNKNINLIITRENEFIRNDEKDEAIYIYSKSNAFDYVLVDEKKPKEELVPFPVLIGIYKVGDENKAEFILHLSLDNFLGYLYAKPELQPCSSDSMHIIRLALH